ncbi:MAG: hypothetical protein HY537_01930 [Deltaproteobacteria bacterium]|nr:hypothetical protein [Deltaproteobacteria bacterium]
MQRAKYDLADVFELVDAKMIDFTVPKKSVNAVVTAYKNSQQPLTVLQAEEFICRGLKTLTEINFVGSQLQWETVVVDKYGLIFDQRPWFVKFAIGEDGRLEEISFHPPVKAFTTLGGIKIPKGESHE